MNQPTRISCLTPAGTGAIATLALRGPMAWKLFREIFRPSSNRPLSEKCPDTGTVLFGRLGRQLSDEVVVAALKSAPEPWLEIHCHGGQQVIDWLIELFVERGAVPCQQWELLRPEGTTLESLANENLARTITLRTATILLDQQQGAMRQAFENLRSCLQSGNVNTALKEVRSMLKFTGLGQHLVVPWKVVVAGAPNAGKSSLVNALAGFPRSIVTPIPGTTRDAVSTLLAIDGWPVELIDTAGIHLAAVGLEKEGIELARAQIANSDLCLWVMDVTAPPVQAESAFLADPVQVLNVANKVDRLPAWQTETCCPVSALTGEGLLGLCQQMSQHLCPEAPQAGVAVPFCSEVLAALQTIDQALVDGKIDSALANCNSWL